MSIYMGLEQTILQLRAKIERLQTTVKRNHKSYIETVCKQTARIEAVRLGAAEAGDYNRKRIDDLMAQNNELSDRIHLDLEPRIKRQLAEIQAFDEMNNKLREERDSFEASDRSACIDYEEMLKANDGLQTRIDALKLALIAVV